jgi:hypothetical protein
MKAVVLSMVMMAMVAVNALAGSETKTEKPGEPAVANTSISGVIVDEETGEALTGVEVKLNGSEEKTYTDFDGKFVFDGVTPGDYSVEAKIISYKPVERKLKVNTNEMHALNLELGTVAHE